jgi:MoaA/NifB/PqqE/SkfB family radical SAM enzyme
MDETQNPLRDVAADLGFTLRWDLPVPYSESNPVSIETEEDGTPSGAGKAWMYVEPDGDVLPTQGAADQVLGNLLRDSWEKIHL